MLPLLRTRRWLGFTALVVFAIAAFGLLSAWQWSRAEQHRVERLELLAAQSRVATALPVNDDLHTLAPWQHVTLTGTFRPHSTVLARLRYHEGRHGFWVLGALDLADGRTVWVSRGWIPADGPATSVPASPDLPVGEVTLIGAWQSYEDVPADRQSGMPAGMVAGIEPRVLSEATTIDSDIPGYVQAVRPDDPALQPVVAPQVDEGRNISYAVQWLLFAVVAVIGWWTFLRREAQGGPGVESVTSQPGPR